VTWVGAISFICAFLLVLPCLRAERPVSTSAVMEP
jgi:hypothetical protein